MNTNFGDAKFDPYHPINFISPDPPRCHLATVSIHTKSIQPQTARARVPKLTISPNLDWDSLLASFFDWVEATALGSGSRLSSLDLNDFSLPEPWAARGSGFNILFLPPNNIPSDGSAPEFTGTNYDLGVNWVDIKKIVWTETDRNYKSNLRNATLGHSINSVRLGGSIDIIELVSGPILFQRVHITVLRQNDAGPVDIIIPTIFCSLKIRGLYVGSVSELRFHDMNKLITANPKTTHPIIDCVFPFEEAKAVFTYLSSQPSAIYHPPIHRIPHLPVRAGVSLRLALGHLPRFATAGQLIGAAVRGLFPTESVSGGDTAGSLYQYWAHWVPGISSRKNGRLYSRVSLQIRREGRSMITVARTAAMDDTKSAVT
ncbi:hypothetical protein B0H14DRAFT_3123633 [Mycena olivaceomarginata]|nr:hypothetical protein B0H14DRAFT_3123633 [Mycena olivaceomarginata]